MFRVEKPHPANTFSSRNPIPQPLFHQKTLSRKHFFIEKPYPATIFIKKPYPANNFEIW